MAWPSSGYTLGDDVQEAELARATWAAVAGAVAAFEPVTMVVDPAAAADAARHLGPAVDVLHAPLDWFGPHVKVVCVNKPPRLLAIVILVS